MEKFDGQIKTTGQSSGSHGESVGEMIFGRACTLYEASQRHGRLKSRPELKTVTNKKVVGPSVLLTTFLFVAVTDSLRPGVRTFLSANQFGLLWYNTRQTCNPQKTHLRILHSKSYVTAAMYMPRLLPANLLKLNITASGVV